MRTFKTVPVSAERHTDHLWSLIAIEDDGSEVTLDRYSTGGNAEAAKRVLERPSLQPPP
jgi:hypothetical protein